MFQTNTQEASLTKHPYDISSVPSFKRLKIKFDDCPTSRSTDTAIQAKPFKIGQFFR